MDRKTGQDGLEHEHEQEQNIQPVQRRLSPVAQFQRTVGNSRLLQLRAMQRAAIQRHDAFDAAREDAAARFEAHEQARLEQAADQISIPAGGQPLPAAVQARAEKHLGMPMDDVRVVHGADSATDPIQAQAFTTHDGGAPKVVMGSGVDLNSKDGQFTLMHELTHVAQQKQGMSNGLAGLGGDNGLRDHLESHADQNAAQMLASPVQASSGHGHEHGPGHSHDHSHGHSHDHPHDHSH